MARVNATRIWVIIDPCLHLENVGKVISERGAFAGCLLHRLLCRSSALQPRMKTINGEPTDESFQSLGSDIVLPPERHESIWHRCRPRTGTNLVN